jgi:hypothetical protein
MAYTHVQSLTEAVVAGSARTLTPSGMGGANFTTGSRVFAGLLYYQNGADPQRTVVSVTNQSATPITYAEPATQRYASDTGMVVVDIPNMPAGVTALIITISGPPAFGSNGFLSEYTGLATTAADGANSLSASVGTGTDAVVSGTASNASQPAICWGVSTDSQGNSVPNAGTGFTSRVGANALRLEDKALSTMTSQQATFTNSSGASRNHITYMIIADEPGAGGDTLMAQVMM